MNPVSIPIQLLKTSNIRKHKKNCYRLRKKTLPVSCPNFSPTFLLHYAFLSFKFIIEFLRTAVHLHRMNATFSKYNLFLTKNFLYAVAKGI